MVKAITNTSQLAIFDTLKSVLKSSSTLSRKLRDNDYYEYEPNPKSLSFKQLPYISLTNKTTDTGDTQTTNRKTGTKNFTVSFVLVIDYQARDKIREYTEAILRQIESNESSFTDVGYDQVFIDVVSVTPEIINGHQVITTTFELTYSGVVDR